MCPTDKWQYLFLEDSLLIEAFIHFVYHLQPVEREPSVDDVDAVHAQLVTAEEDVIIHIGTTHTRNLLEHNEVMIHVGIAAL